MTVAHIENMMPFSERKASYDCDITYGTNSEFGFDYLRDNMAVSLEQCVQRGHTYAIVDEVDSILVDEARTPLIISGEPETAAQVYHDFARVARTLKGMQQPKAKPGGAEEIPPGIDFTYDEKFKTVAPMESAIEKVERALGLENLYDPRNVQLVNHLNQALKAEALYQRDVDYVVQDGEVKIVDEFTGRIMEGRRWSEGLHQAVEAKEGVRIQEEHVTLATITLQNYFRLYEKLGGMTGTAKTEEKEFVEIYGTNVVEIPTNEPVARDDKNDFIYKTIEGKFKAVIDDIKERHAAGQPILVGTIAVETSEYLAELLTRAGIQHNVLNAKQHEREAEIIKDAGQRRRGHDRDEHGRPRRRHQARRGRARARRPLCARHGAPRGAAHRQPAPRPFGPPGRPGRVALLPLGAGQPRAPVRRRPHLPDHRPLQDPRRPADGGEDPLEADRERAEEGRGAELRLAEERPQVRRRDEQAARRHLRAAAEGARGRGPLRGGDQLARRGDRGGRRGVRRPGVERHRPRRARPRTCSSSTASEITADELREDGITERSALVEEFIEDAREEYAGKEEELGSDLMRELERFVSSRSSTPAGASTSRTWTTSARACTCGRWRRRTRWSSTPPRVTGCSRS